MGEVDIQRLALTVERHDVRIADVEDSFDEHTKKQNGSLDKIWTKLNAIDEYQRSEVARRPTWAVAGTIAALTTICTGLVVYVVTH